MTLILGRAQRARIQQIAKGRSDEPLRVLEGAKAVRDALDAGVVRELWLRRDLEADLDGALRTRAVESGVVVGEGDAGDFERMGGTVSPQGVLALVADTATTLDLVLDAAGLRATAAGRQRLDAVLQHLLAGGDGASS